jgi:hemolysin-activating ACP:hemolysin acyltransferase
MTPTKEDVDDIMYLMQRSSYHDWYGVKEVNDYIRTPLLLNQYIILRDEGRVPLLFATWGFPNNGQVSDYLQDLRFPADGYDGGGDVPWMIDLIAEGGKRNIVLAFRKVKSVLSSKGYNKAFWFRTETEKLGFHQWGDKDGQC